MNRWLRVGLAATALTAPGLTVEAQSASAPARAFGIGWSPAAGLIGVEFVDRSFAHAPRLGAAAGIGLAGVGARLNIGLRDPVEHRRLPYVGVGYVTTPWLPVLKMSGAASIEGGVQLWPSRPDGVYCDIGAGVAFLTGASSTTGPVLRLLVGHTL